MKFWNKPYKYLLAAIFLFLVILPFGSCYYDSKEFLYPELSGSCDTTKVTYSLSIEPVISNYCLACHSAASSASLGGNIVLDGYNNVKTYADNKMLYGTISYQSGYPSMPLGASKLDDCTISLFQKWINAGSPNN